MALAYTSRYPPAYSDTYVKATTILMANFEAYNACNPAKPLTGDATTRSWVANAGSNQRFHIDLGVPRIIRRIYYENYHSSGGNTTLGSRAFTLWGSNNAGAFAELTYAVDTNWKAIATAVAEFAIHAAADAEDPKYILVSNGALYRYYAIKVATSWGAANLGLRRIVLQTQDGYGGGAAIQSVGDGGDL